MAPPIQVRSGGHGIGLMPPRNTLRLDQSNGLVRGMQHFLPLDGNSRDLVRGGSLAYGAGASIEPSQRGKVLRGNGSAAVASIPMDLQSLYCSVRFWLYWPSYANDDKLALEFTAGNVAAGRGFFFNPNSGAPAFGTWAIAVTRGGGGVYIVTIPRPSAGAWHQFDISMFSASGSALGSVLHAYVDSVPQPITAAYLDGSNGGGTFASSTLYLLSRHNGLYSAGRMQNLVIRLGAANIPTADEVRAAYLRPWQYFERPAPRRRPQPAAGGAFKAAWSVNSNAVIQRAGML